MFKATLIANPFWQGLHFLFFKLSVPVAFNMTYVWKNCGTLVRRKMCVCVLGVRVFGGGG